MFWADSQCVYRVRRVELLNEFKPTVMQDLLRLRWGGEILATPTQCSWRICGPSARKRVTLFWFNSFCQLKAHSWWLDWNLSYFPETEWAIDMADTVTRWAISWKMARTCGAQRTSSEQPRTQVKTPCKAWSSLVTWARYPLFHYVSLSRA